MSDLPGEPRLTSSEALPPPTGGSGTTSTQDLPAAQSTAQAPSPGDESKAETARGEAKQVADTALASGQNVAATAKNEAENVAAEARQQAGSLLDTVRSEVGQQASTSQSRIADALHDLSKELGGMASSSDESGPLTDLAHEASRKGGEVAHWLQDHEPADVLEEVRSYARRRPGTFLVLCGLAGVVAGRLTRSAVASRTSLDSSAGPTKARPATSDGSTAGAPDGQAAAITRRHEASVSRSAPDTGDATERSIGVYGGSLETTEPAVSAETLGDPTLPGSGFAGSERAFDDPDGDRNR